MIYLRRPASRVCNSPGVKITDLRATPVNIPLRAPYRFAYGSIASLTKTVVEVVTDEGVVGLGEIAGGDRSAAALAFRDRLIGVDILDLNEAERRCVPAARYSPWDDALGHRRVFGGIEMALWDARGRAEDRSLSDAPRRRRAHPRRADGVLLAAARRPVGAGRVDARSRWRGTARG